MVASCELNEIKITRNESEIMRSKRATRREYNRVARGIKGKEKDT
tara:strand:+ start:143 stop:277 length:135 start_codon:yes stop_codon:yes gene_type:complete